MKYVMLSEGFMEKLHLNSTFKLIKWKSAETEMSLCMIPMGKEEDRRTLPHDRYEFNKVFTLDSTQSWLVLVQSKAYIILLAIQSSFNKYVSCMYFRLSTRGTEIFLKLLGMRPIE